MKNNNSNENTDNSVEEGFESISSIKSKLLKRMEDIDDPILLSQLNHVLDGDYEEKDEYEQLIESVLVAEKEDELFVHQKPPIENSPLVLFENLIAGFMFWFSFAMLCLLGIIIMFTTSGEVSELIPSHTIRTLTSTYLSLMMIPALELVAILFLFARSDHPGGIHHSNFALRLISIPLPPLRMMMPRFTASEWLWLPSVGWSKKNHALFNRLRHDFSTPMIIIALLIIPLVLIDFRFQDQVQVFIPNIKLYLEMGQAFIWVAFALEFMLMISVTDEKVPYCAQNWMDLIIILLPLVYFLRTLRIFRAFQGVARIQQLGRLYRLRSTMTKMRQALILAEVVTRIIHPNPEKQLKGLQKKLRRHRRNHQLIEGEVVRAVERLKKKHAKDAEKEAKQELQANVKKAQEQTKEKALKEQAQLVVNKRAKRKTKDLGDG